jgi:type VI secretion system protein ImpA
VKEMTLLLLPGLGPLDIRALEFATGETQPGKDQQVLSVASIEQALADIEPAVLSDVVDLLARALASVVNIEVLLVRHVGSSQALNLDMLTRPLRKAHEFLLRHQVLAPDAEDTEVLLDEGSVDGSDGAGNPGNESAGARRISGDIASREDVLRTLDKLLQYYSKHEPASPIPIFIERAKRLVPMTFMEVLEEMVPGGAAQVAVLRGPGAE